MSDKFLLWTMVFWISLELLKSGLRLFIAIMEQNAGSAAMLTLSIVGALVLVAHVIDMARREA